MCATDAATASNAAAVLQLLRLSLGIDVHATGATRNASWITLDMDALDQALGITAEGSATHAAVVAMAELSQPVPPVKVLLPCTGDCCCAGSGAPPVRTAAAARGPASAAVAVGPGPAALLPLLLPVLRLGGPAAGGHPGQKTRGWERQRPGQPSRYLCGGTTPALADTCGAEMHSSISVVQHCWQQKEDIVSQHNHIAQSSSR